LATGATCRAQVVRRRKAALALARAKVLGRRSLLLDEPTANLDGDARRQVLELVTSLASTTILWWWPVMTRKLSGSRF